VGSVDSLWSIASPIFEFPAFLMPPPVFVAVVTSLVIVLRFDGSLRPPRDPVPGFTYSHDLFRGDSSRKPLLDNSEKLASCSATISLSSLCDGCRKEMPIAIGGRYLSNTPRMTSATTEYEGLLLGLEWLEQLFSSLLMSNQTSDAVNLINKEHEVECSKLIIKGDCKSVIDQMNSRSVPRKMEPHYNSAISRIECIRDLYAGYHQRTTGHLGTLKVCFEHVPREENYFCDAICNLIINQKQVDFLRSINDLILLGENIKTNSAGDEPFIDTFNTRRNTYTMQPTSVYFKQALDEICHNPQLYHSSRLALACVLTEASIRKKDVAILSDISGFFMNMSRRWSKYYYAANGHDAVGKDTLRKVGITCEKLSKHFSGPSLGDNELCCDGIKSVFDFCTNYKVNYYEGSDVVLSTSAVKYFSDISDIINIVEKECQIDGLPSWNIIATKDVWHDISLISIAKGCGWKYLDRVKV
jgi:ribonuclease HI